MVYYAFNDLFEEKYMNKKVNGLLIYEITTAVLAVIAVTMALLDILGTISIEENIGLIWLDRVILIIFTIDYFTRLVISENKKEFVKTNVFDLIAIIPFNSVFRAFRVVRVFRVARLAKLSKMTKIFRLVRILAFSKRFSKQFKKFVKTNGFIYTLVITIATIVIGALSIFVIEKGKTIETFSDAIWWSFVTVTTVGYGDISPSTGLGRFVAGILMIIGIGFLGMLTGTIATFFLSKSSESICEETTNEINDTLVIYKKLTNEQKNEVIDYIDYLVYRDDKNNKKIAKHQ
jgi:voltage-gated potassium channel